MEFYEKRKNWLKDLIIFQNQYANPMEEEKDEFSIASSKHYDFLPPTITAFSGSVILTIRTSVFWINYCSNLRWSSASQDFGIILIPTIKNKKGIMHGPATSLAQVIESTLSYSYLSPWGHLWKLRWKRNWSRRILADLTTVRFTQEKDRVLYYSRTLLIPSESSQMFNVTDRATLNGILERRTPMRQVPGF